MRILVLTFLVAAIVSPSIVQPVFASDDAALLQLKARADFATKEYKKKADEVRKLKAEIDKLKQAIELLEKENTELKRLKTNAPTPKKSANSSHSTMKAGTGKRMEPAGSKSQSESNDAFKIERFRDYKWGDGVEKYPELKVTTIEGGGKDWYEHKRESLKIGKAKLSSIYYYFWNDHLLQIVMTADGSRNCDELKRVLTARYGTPMQSDLNKDGCIWENKFIDISFVQEEIDKCSLRIDGVKTFNRNEVIKRDKLLRKIQEETSSR